MANSFLKTKTSMESMNTQENNDFIGYFGNNPQWFDGEAQLSCDVYETKNDIIVRTTVAGVKPEDLDISISNDLLTIRGSRQQEDEAIKEDYYSQECYWGAFSRSIVLPREVDQKKIDANLKNGVLTIKLPKKYKTSGIKIRQINE
jgi:HSP20 family protein